MRRSSLGAALGLVALSFVWGSQFLVIQLGQRDLPPLLSLALRFTLLAAVAQVAMWVTRARAPRGRAAERLGLGATQALSMGLLYWAGGHLPSSLTGVLFATLPFFVVGLAHHYVPGERVTLRGLAGTALGFAGVALITLSGTHDGDAANAPDARSLPAMLACLGAAFAGGVNRVVSKRLTAALSVWVQLRDAGFFVATAMFAASFALERERAVVFSGEAVAAFLYLGLVASAAASALYLALLRRHAVSSLTYIQFGNAVVAMLVGAVVAREPVHVQSGVGVLAVLFGLCLVLGRSTPTKRPDRRPRPGGAREAPQEHRPRRDGTERPGCP